jgi:hypothetical protein
VRPGTAQQPYNGTAVIQQHSSLTSW